MRLRWLVLSFLAAIAIGASACVSADECSGCKDLDIRVPWGATESHVYKLQIDGKDIGRTTLSIRETGDRVVLTSRAEDDDGNVDESTVTADAKTLKPVLNDPGTEDPIRNMHTVADDDEVRTVRTVYESGADDCDTGSVVKIELLVFDPDDVATAVAAKVTPTPDNTRSSPLCVPEAAYDNDESLFLWRAIPFEEGYKGTYRTILTNRRATQIISLEVHGKVDKTPLGDGEAWEVRLTADQINQRAWFSTDPSHKMLAYQNADYLFLLEE